MAEKRNSDSYETCINRLHARYDGRGTAVNAANELRGLTAAGSNAPNAYLIARMKKGEVSEKFKNGEYNGQKYMTTGDFLKYYNSHKNPTAGVQVHRPAPVTKEFKKPQVSIPAENAVQRANDVARRADNSMRSVRKQDPNADTIVMPAQKSSKKIKNRVAKLFEKWFLSENKSEKKAEYKKNIPVAAVGLLISVSVAMTIIVGTTVMANDAQNSLSNIKYEIKELETERATLEEELTKRNDLSMISDYAQNDLGMIKQEFVSSVYMEIGESDSANGGAEGERQDLGSLLSAMFGS